MIMYTQLSKTTVRWGNGCEEEMGTKPARNLLLLQAAHFSNQFTKTSQEVDFTDA